MSTTINKKIITTTIVEEKFITDTTGIDDIDLPTGYDDIPGKTIDPNETGTGANVLAPESTNKNEPTNQNMTWASLVYTGVAPILSQNKYVILIITLYIIAFALAPKNFSVKGILYWLVVGSLFNLFWALPTGVICIVQWSNRRKSCRHSK